MIDIERFPKISDYRGVTAQLDKVVEEVDEVRQALNGDDLMHVYDEVTDIFLASVTLFNRVVPDQQKKRMIGRAFRKNRKRGYYDHS